MVGGDRTLVMPPQSTTITGVSTKEMDKVRRSISKWPEEEERELFTKMLGLDGAPVTVRDKAKRGMA